jgi:hypothetical protein
VENPDATILVPNLAGYVGHHDGIRVRRNCNFFFIRFEANLSEHGSYSLHIRMLRYIRKHHLFASFASYSLQNIRTNLHTNIRFDAK